ncbi:MAG: c-type cytochrome biogenesis protein CcsB [Desulfococcus sp. 4484_241]|nr:MAG: c-type cytochrome biogenesis protein CcsB [Desulfococcus sp. 4484_241]
MLNSYILSYTTFIYGLAMVCYMSGLIFKSKIASKAGTVITIIAAVCNLLGIIIRWAESYKLGFGHIPLSNLYESLVFFAFAVSVVYLVFEARFSTRAFGAATTLFAFLALAYASLKPGAGQEIQPLIPALKSNWLTAHVITCFLGYSAFAIAFGISVIYLLTAGKDDRASVHNKGIIPPPETLDEIIYQTVVFGFFFLSIGIITGAVWANTAWGRYWGWDPKETWSLITWFIYATLLHARLMRGWQHKRIAWFAIIGFGAVLFTYFGVNLLPGLHSYQ